MSWRELWQILWQENRKLIICLVIVIIVLIITITALFLYKNSLQPTDSTASNEPPVQSPAAISALDVNSHIDELHAVITDAYSPTIKDYQIETGELLEDGSWYITTMKEPSVNQWSLGKDTFRIILHKIDNKWQIVAGPQLTFAYIDFPNIPRSIIYSANQL